MERYVITTGDFLKNAGIVGMNYMLKSVGAREGIDFDITEDAQGLWISKDFAENADWTDFYFRAFVKYFGSSTTYQRIVEKIEICLEKISAGAWKSGKTEKEDLKFINDKLLSNSYQAGFDNMKEVVENPTVYVELKKNKLSDKLEVTDLEQRLTELLRFITQPKCMETFTMKSVVYTYINRFWNGKCFLLRANAKKDMRKLFENEFSEPLRNYWKQEHTKAKDLCIDCGMPVESKEKVSIAFMNEMADDLTRKRSAFWNCNVDAYLCPACAFVYALSPLGFQLFANKFVFVNVNESVQHLLTANRKDRKELWESEKEDNERYSAWFARILNTVLSEKEKELTNVQVILRGTQAEDRYMFSIISSDAMKILNKPKIAEGLEHLSKHPFIKIKGEFINVHETVVTNVLQYRSQYALLDKILKESLENEGVLISAYWVYMIQLWSAVIKRKEGEKEVNEKKRMVKAGYDLRKAIIKAKGHEPNECMRGTIYQLINSLSVRNKEKFIDIIIRLYSSLNIQIPNGFVYMLGNPEEFSEYGYSFILGLEGSYPDYKTAEDGKENVQ